MYMFVNICVYIKHGGWENEVEKKESGIVRIINNAIWYNKDLQLLWCLIIKNYSPQRN